MKKIIPITKINHFEDHLINFNIENYFQRSFFKKNKEINKILIIKWGGMGDVVQSSSIINDILFHLKSKKIDINTRSEWDCFFKYDKRINKIWSIDFKKGWGDFFNAIKWIKKVKNEKYDLIIDLQTNDKSRILLSFLKIFFNYPNFSIGNHFVFPYSIKPKSNINITQPFYRLKRTILTLGIKSTSNRPNLIIPHSSKQKVKKILQENKITNKYLYIFIPGSSPENLLKRWGANNFIDLANLINSNMNKVVLVGGKDDKDECNQISKSNQKIINLCNKLDLLDLVELFNQAKYIIANDTGPTHLASSTNTPTIQITGPTDPFKVKPFGENISSIQAEISCKNCYKKICGHHSCMLGIKPIDIFNFISKKI